MILPHFDVFCHSVILYEELKQSEIILYLFLSFHYMNKLVCLTAGEGALKKTSQVGDNMWKCPSQPSLYIQFYGPCQGLLYGRMNIEFLIQLSIGEEIAGKRSECQATQCQTTVAYLGDTLVFLDACRRSKFVSSIIFFLGSVINMDKTPVKFQFE